MNRSPLNALAVSTSLFVALLVGVGCGGDKTGSGGTAAPTVGAGTVTMPKKFNTPPGADPTVSAELGGAGFEKFAADSGWSDGAIPADQIELIGDPNAKKGGQFVSAIADFPATFRIFGKDASTATNQQIYSLVYETLIDVNPLTLSFVPALASHWKVDPADSQTYWFRINPNARFSDGHPVTTEDVIATTKLGLDPEILDPYYNSFYAEFEPPVAVSKYILKVRSKENNWKNMLYFGGQPVYPAHVIGGVKGGEFLKKFQTEMPPGSGPYVMLPEGLQKQRSITLTRLADWWAKDEPVYTGQYNFDRLKFNFVEDENLQYEKLRAGDIDWLLVLKSKDWVQKFDFDEVQRGLIQKRKVWNNKPQGLQGFAFNMRKPPFDDPKVRLAWTYLYNREELIEKLMFNERTIADSYFPGSVNENPNNPKYRYDPAKAATLLAEAGYSTRNADGILMKNGKPFVVELAINKGDEMILGPVQQDLQKAGIKMNFRFVDFAQKVKLMDERSFEVARVAYAGILYPNPEGQLHSKFANQKNTGNVTGFNSPRADELIMQEKVTSDPAKRAVLLRELDSIVMHTNAYALDWYSPFERFAAWSYIEMPKFGIGRILDYRDVVKRWWFDPEKKALVDKARKDNSIKLEVPPVDIRFWQEYDKKQVAAR